MTAPRILIDLAWMIPGQAGGLEDVAFSFLSQVLARADLGAKAGVLTLIVPSQIVDAFRAMIPATVSLRTRDDVASDALRLLRVLTRNHAPAHGGKYDVIYSMNGRLRPEFAATPATVLVSDVQHLVHPNFFEPIERATRTTASLEVASRASHIITISEFSRREIMRRLAISPERVSCVYLAVDPIFEQEPTPAARNAVLARYGLLNKRYIFFPAQIWPHKNHATLFAALDLLANAGADPPLLVCTGSMTTRFARELVASAGSRQNGALIRFLGNCPRPDMPALFSAARMLVFCSLYEGFGMPVIEAMKMGCPVITSNSTSLPEVAGDAALLVDPLDERGIAAAIVRLLDDQNTRTDLITKGYARAARFSWRQHCQMVLELIYASAGYPPPGPSQEASLNLRGAYQPSSICGNFRASIYPRFRQTLSAALRRSKFMANPLKEQNVNG